MIYFHIPLDRSEKRLYNTCKRNAYRHIVRCQIDGNYPVGGTESVENREILYEYQDNRFVLEQQNGWYSKWTNYYIEPGEEEYYTLNLTNLEPRNYHIVFSDTDDWWF